jgi:AraC-like DNA-binding protein
MRNVGAWTFYLALETPFELSEDGGPFVRLRFALVAPWMPHRLVTQDRDIGLIHVEPESVDGHSLVQELMGTSARREQTAAGVLRGFERTNGSADNFDVEFFGRPLKFSNLDPRILRIAEQIGRRDSPEMTGHRYAAAACLSFSRFMHLFSRELNTTFRRFRAWKRARRLLGMMGGTPSLVRVALDAGYADSTHLSRSVRRCWGYTPSAMFEGARRLAFIAQSGIGGAAPVPGRLRRLESVATSTLID